MVGGVLIPGLDVGVIVLLMTPSVITSVVGFDDGVGVLAGVGVLLNEGGRVIASGISGCRVRHSVGIRSVCIPGARI